MLLLFLFRRESCTHTQTAHGQLVSDQIMKTVTKIRKCMWRRERELAHQPRAEKGPHTTTVNETIISKRKRERMATAEEKDCDGLGVREGEREIKHSAERRRANLTRYDHQQQMSTQLACILAILAVLCDSLLPHCSPASSY